jgi:hypothetical protein
MGAKSDGSTREVELREESNETELVLVPTDASDRFGIDERTCDLLDFMPMALNAGTGAESAKAIGDGSRRRHSGVD